MKDQPTFFAFAAEVGLTKHIGGMAATETLIELCHIGRESTILDVGASVKPLTPDEWVGLLDAAGLKEITAQVYAVDIQDEAKGILQRYGWAGMLRIMGRTLRLYMKSPTYRDFVKRVRQGGIVPDNLNEYFGYGLFVGRKG